MNNELTNVLIACASADATLRKNAENVLTNLEKNDFQKYVQLLSLELASPNKPMQSIQMAGILLKNAIDAKGAELRTSLRQRWLSINQNDRTKIHQTLLNVLCCANKDSRDVAALVVAKIAAVELSGKNWTDVGDILLKIAINQIAEISASALKALGLLCEEAPDYMAGRVNELLEFCCLVATADKPDGPQKLEALATIYQALVFAEQIFTQEKTRKVVMAIIFDATSSSTQTTVIALDCLSRAADLFYENISAFIPDVLRVTTALLTNPSTPLEVQLHAAEFWAVLSELEAAPSTSAARPTPDPSLGYVRRSLPGLVPALLAVMSNQGGTAPDRDPEDVPMASSAAGGVLSLVAQCAGDALVQNLMPFFRSNLNSPDWGRKEAALSALGVAMEGPPLEDVRPLLSNSFGGLLHCAENDSPTLREAASWALARSCGRLGKDILSSSQMKPLAESLHKQLRDARPKVAANACLAISNLSESCGDKEKPLLAPHFKAIAEALLVAARRADNDEAHLEAAAFEALNSLILAVGAESADAVVQICALFSTSLVGLAGAVHSSSQKMESSSSLQALLVGSISTIVKILPGETVSNQVNELMKIFFGVLHSQDKTIYEEVLLAVAVIINKIGQKFAPFLDRIKPFLTAGLSGSLGFEVCNVSIGVVGDLFRSLGSAHIPLSDRDGFIETLLKIITTDGINRHLKPTAISVLGDIALTLENDFERYLDFVLNSITQFSAISPDEGDFESTDFVNDLRCSVFEAFASILHATKNLIGRARLVPHLHAAIAMIKKIVSEPERPDAVSAAALEFIGDVVRFFGKDSALMVDSEPVRKLVDLNRHSADERVQSALLWLRSGGSPSLLLF